MAVFILLKDKDGKVTHEVEQTDPVEMTVDELAERYRVGNYADSYEIVPADQVNKRLMDLVNDKTLDLKTASIISINFHKRNGTNEMAALADPDNGGESGQG
jgi:L-arabinose isomerase